MHKKTCGLLTIVVPCYNAEKYLDRCFSSLDSLNFEDVSILFVNDGSKDRTLPMLETWTAKHNSACIVNKENGGYATAINTGLDNCGSEYVMFMGVDDELIQSGIERVCRTLRDRQPDILVFTTVKHYDDVSGGVSREVDLATQYNHAGEYETDIAGLCRAVGNDAWILFARDTSRCFKMSLIDKQRYFGKTGVSSDGCFAGLIACRAQKFIFMNETGYLWHVHQDSVSGSGRKKTPEKLAEEADVWRAFFSQIQKEFTSIPDPIVSHLFTYMRLIDQLRVMEMLELSDRHRIIAKTFLKWARKNAAMSLKSRCKLVFPTAYSIFRKIKP